MMDLEDGELPSEDEGNSDRNQSTNNNNDFTDVLDSDYVILDRPKSEFVGSSGAAPVPSRSPAPSSLSLPVAGTASTIPSGSSKLNLLQSQPMNIVDGSSSQSNLPIIGIEPSVHGKMAYYKGLGVSDLLDSPEKDSGSESDGDSDDDRRLNGKRSRMNTPYHQDAINGRSSGFAFSTLFGSDGPQQRSMAFSNGFSSTTNVTQQQGFDAFSIEAAKFHKEHQDRKPNLVWANVIQDEQMSNMFSGVKVAEPGAADVEVTRGPETYSFQRPMRQPRERRDSDSSDISSGGLSDNALHYLRDGCSLDDEETTGESSEHSLPLSFTSTSCHRPAHSRKATKQRRTRQKYKNKLIKKLKKMKATELSQYMANKMNEEKVQLLVRAIEILGKENCIHIFLKTLKIERRGGIMVKNQKRRRTAGGVFLYLIRGDRRFPKSQIDLIFRDDRMITEKFKRKKQIAKRLRAKAKLESALESFPGKEEYDSEGTAVPEVEQDGTDTGQYGDDSTQESSVNGRDTNDMHCDGSES